MRGHRTSISMPRDVFEKAAVRQRELGYATFSDYIQALIRADSLSGSAHVRAAIPSSSQAGPKKGTSDPVVDIVKKHYPKAPRSGRPKAPK